MYKITIEKVTPTKTTTNSWERLRDQYDNEQEMTREQKNADPQFGYATVEADGELVQVILKQEIEELDVSSVIKAINNI